MITGIDEAGRGPLAGPVVAAAVILDPKQPIEGLTDSKKLSPKRREELAEEIKNKALAYGIGMVDHHTIDQINILQASLLAMQKAFEQLNRSPTLALVDGLHCPKLPCHTQAIVRGDATVPAISAASILAKVARDAFMLTMDAIYPAYGFAKHKGYPTKAHRLAIQEHGLCHIHRMSFSYFKKNS